MPQLPESIFLATPEVLEEAYLRQEMQYFQNENFIEREASFGVLEKVFGFLFNNPDHHQMVNKQIKMNNKKKPASVSTSAG